MAVSCASFDAGEDLSRLVEKGEQVGVLSVIPPLNGEWVIVKEIEIYQYVWPSKEGDGLDSEAVLLEERHIPAMLELTALVYPAYFRQETARLGDYFGFLDGDRLCAMAGIRMSMTGYQELSAICTHPDYRGRGLASRLTSHLVERVTRQGDVPFLHTEHDNVPAQGVYERLGFVLNQTLRFVVVAKP